jgi:HB1, ASXL, restriction endonuclease HTH domain
MATNEGEALSPSLPELLAAAEAELASIDLERRKLDERERDLNITLAGMVALAKRIPAKAVGTPLASNGGGEGLSLDEVIREEELPLLNAAIRVLERTGKPMGTTEINDYLFKQGRHKSKEALYKTLWSALKTETEKRDSLLVKVGPKWGLTIWGPPAPSSSPAAPWGVSQSPVDPPE